MLGAKWLWKDYCWLRSRGHEIRSRQSGSMKANCSAWNTMGLNPAIQRWHQSQHHCETTCWSERKIEATATRRCRQTKEDIGKSLLDFIYTGLKVCKDFWPAQSCLLNCNSLPKRSCFSSLGVQCTAALKKKKDSTMCSSANRINTILLHIKTLKYDLPTLNFLQ